ncbi:MAG: tRNA (adenosine(37)-N6)-threonylcarbamoyltransferase complex transferase subunit TsaD [bacterium]
MNILAIETSCDETAAAILEIKEEKDNLNFKVLANIVSSQTESHRAFGGVVPNLAATLHLENILPSIKKSFAKAKIEPQKLDFIAVTAGPGLAPALLVGVNTARTLAWLWQKPIISVNHVEAHLLVNWLEIRKKNIFPAIGLVVSGGHTQLILLKDFGQYQLIGETRDDAAGEAFDKIARLLGLGYPGGPAIEKAAQNFKKGTISLPRPMIKSDNFDFSFSGLKTAVSLLVKERKLTQNEKNEFARAVQKTIIDVLVSKTIRAVKTYQIKTLVLSGGVVANGYLRKEFKKSARRQSLKLIIPPINYCTDNAVMIGVAAYFKVQRVKDFSYPVNSKIYGTCWQKVVTEPDQEFI